MHTYKALILTLIKRLALIYTLFFVSRVLFYLLNLSHFQGLESGYLISIFFYGLRFDTYSILVCNSVFILLSVLPFQFVLSSKFQHRLKRFFVISNAIFLVFNFIDIAYFKFIGKRSTFDLFNQIGGQTDVVKQIPYYIKDFWYIIILFCITIYCLNKFYSKLKITAPHFDYSSAGIAKYSVIILMIASLTVLGIRGGFQRVPIDFSDAGNYTKPQHSSLVLNTPFTLIKSVIVQSLTEYNFVPNETAYQFIKPVKHFQNKSFKPQNVVVLILESFSKEYTGIGKRKSITPFLDSLMKSSLVFTNAWANGTKSIEGIPAILSSIPSLNNDPFINTPYSNNTTNSIAGLLKEKNYRTAFFHGGINGTMNFVVYAKQSGFDNYYGKDEYNNDADFDGNWGIYDEPYLQYCSKTISTFKEPFMASIFTLSSHHPYKIPEQYEGKFPKTNEENSESIGYADYALKQFFATASKQAWFKNTLFVLVADHASISSDLVYTNKLGQHAIPILFYKADGSYKGVNKNIIQQIDIMPSILDTLGYDKPFFSFGKSVFSETNNSYAVFYESGNVSLVDDSIFYTYNNFKPIQIIRYRTDSTIEYAISNHNSQKADNYLKQFLQVHNHSIINNKMTAETAH